MAEINFNNIYDQMPGTVKNSYDGVMGGQSFSDQYNPDKRTVNADGTITDTNSQSLTMKDGYSQMVDAYNQEQNIPETGLLSSIGSALNPFSELSASEMPQTYGLQNIINNTQPQNLGFRSMVDMNNDVQNFDNQFVSPDRFNNMAQMGPVKSNMNAPAALDMERFAGVSNLGRNDMDVEQVEQLGSPSRFQGFKNKIGSGLGSIKDFAMNKGNIGRNLIGSAGAMAMGLPGIVGSGAMSLLGGLGNMFEDRQLSGDGTTVDEYGNSYNASDLNKMNAKGGYYTEAARSSRRRTNRINDMLARKAKGKRISAANLARLQAQEAAQEAARQAATTQMAAANRATYGSDNATGGYQSSFGGDSGFMGGSGTAADMGSFRDGGLASMFTRRR